MKMIDMIIDSISKKWVVEPEPAIMTDEQLVAIYGKEISTDEFLEVFNG